MRLTLYFLRHELRVQGRSWRFRSATLLFLALGAAPAVVVYFYQRRSATLLGAATYVNDVMNVLPLASALLAFVLCSDGILRERAAGMWVALTTLSMGNSAYLLRRWLALTTIVVPLTAVPLVVAVGLALAAGTAAPQWSNVVGPWALQVLPVSVAASALSLGLCTLADGVVAGAVQGALLLILAPALLNRLLAPAARHLDSPSSWLGVDRLMTRLDLYVAAVRHGLRPVAVVSEGGFDAVAAIGKWGTTALFALALGFAALATAANFLRRTRRDLQPWRVSATHGLRGLVGLANRLRIRYTPDARPSLCDRWLWTAGVLALAAAFAAYFATDGRWRGVAARRYATERAAWPAPTAAALVATRWVWRGRLAASGNLEARLTAGLRNGGAALQSHLACSMNPYLKVTSLTASRGSATAEQRWDRLAVSLVPPLAAGEERRLEFALAGRPATLDFALPAPSLAFFARWDLLQAHRLSHDLYDLSTSYALRAASPRRVELNGSDLLPVPRFTTWTLQPVDSATAAPAPEALLRDVDLEFALSAPSSTFLADACGGSTSGGSLRSRCRMPLSDFTVRGAHAEPVPGARPILAVLPQHRAVGETYATGLRFLAAALAEAWPGVTLATPPVLLEWSPAFDPGSNLGPPSSWEAAEDADLDLQAHGALVLIPEVWLATGRRLEEGRVAAELVSGALLRRRPLADRQRFIVGSLVRALVERRLGAGAKDGAVIALQAWQVPQVQIPLIEPDSWRYSLWPLRLNALAADFSARLGDGPLIAGLDAFLARSGGDGSVEELLHDFEHASGSSLAAFYQDYFKGDSLPTMTLKSVVSERRGAGWSVTGRLDNRGTGEALCTVELSTDLDKTDIVLRVSGPGSTPFTFAASRPPQSVQLDPRQTCHRYRPTTHSIIEYVAFGDVSR